MHCYQRTGSGACICQSQIVDEGYADPGQIDISVARDLVTGARRANNAHAVENCGAIDCQGLDGTGLRQGQTGNIRKGGPGSIYVAAAQGQDFVAAARGTCVIIHGEALGDARHCRAVGKLQGVDPGNIDTADVGGVCQAEDIIGAIRRN